MIKKIMIDKQSEEDYELLADWRKEKYQKIYNSLTCCPEEYFIAVDISSPNSKDQLVLIYSEKDEFGAINIKGIKYF